MRISSRLHDLHNHQLKELKSTGIYTITSKINGKIYVGSTRSAFGFEYRWRQHVTELINNRHHNKYLQHHVNKYGINDLEFEILEKCDPKFADSLERYWINMLDSVSYGFNFLYGNICSYSNSHYKFKNLNNAEIINRYITTSDKIQKIAKDYNTSPSKIRSILIRNNVETVNKSSKYLNHKYYIDLYNYFIKSSISLHKFSKINNLNYQKLLIKFRELELPIRNSFVKETLLFTEVYSNDK